MFRQFSVNISAGFFRQEYPKIFAESEPELKKGQNGNNSDKPCVDALELWLETKDDDGRSEVVAKEAFDLILIAEFERTIEFLKC